MSIFGPPESCAMVISPAAISSTTAIPKCSFHMLWIPTVAVEHSWSRWSNFTLTWNYIGRPSANLWRYATRFSSSGLLQEPTSQSSASGWDFCKFLKASICSSWSFSGRNWPIDMAIFRGSLESGSSRNEVTLQGGYRTFVGVFQM